MPKFKNPVQVSTGGYGACAIDEGKVKCWGANFDQQFTVPKNIVNPKQLALGVSQSCVLDSVGVKCWGEVQGQIPQLKNPKEFAIDPSGINVHYCAIDDRGVKCWGDNSSGQATAPRHLKNPRMLALGGSHSCVVTDEGVKCWGDNHYGQSEVPKNLPAVKKLAAFEEVTCAIMVTDQVLCWGKTGHREELRSPPFAVHHPKEITIGRYAACVNDAEGVKCWGEEGQGLYQVPANLQNPRSLSIHHMDACVITGAHEIKCWGWMFDQP